MCQNDTRAMVIVYLPPKSARPATSNMIFMIVLQRDRKLQKRCLGGWPSGTLIHEYTHTSTAAEKHRTVFYCFKLGAAWVRIRTQPTVVVKFVLLYLNQRISLDSLSLFVTYTYIEEKTTLSIFRIANRARQVLFEFYNNKQP